MHNGKKNIPFFNYPSLFNDHREELLDIFSEVSSRGAFIMQNELIEFETNIAQYTKSKHAIGVGNATDALQMLMMAGGVGPGDEVLFCSHTMVATASSIHFTGAKPIPIETANDHLIDIESIEKSINSRTKAICPTQLNGRIANMEEILSIANKHSLQVYEDAAQALGAKFDDRFAGTFDMGGCISFYPAKILGCYGDGGAILCNDDSVAEKLRLMRDHGRDENGDIPVWGFNSRLDNLQAAILNYFFADYEATISRRREIAELYNTGLKDIDQLHLPEPPSENRRNFDIFQNYEIQARDRDKLKSFLSKNGVGTLIQWGGTPVHQFKKLGFNMDLPKTDMLFESLIMLPLNLSISDSDVEYICSLIKKFYS
tara:strand:+ start:9818 stop:10933 length:1116 start_codon:yes stop_codon:yes gene_type:complete